MYVFSYTQIERHLWKTGRNTPQEALSILRGISHP